MDTLGRSIASYVDIFPKKWYLLVCCIRAAIFFVTFMLIWYKVAQSFFSSDWFILFNLGLFSLSCGHIATIGMKFGSDPSTGNPGLAGTIMAIWLIVGCFLGSGLATLVFT